MHSQPTILGSLWCRVDATSVFPAWLKHGWSWSVAIALASLAACGGGVGGSGSLTPTPTSTPISTLLPYAVLHSLTAAMAKIPMRAWRVMVQVIGMAQR